MGASSATESNLPSSRILEIMRPPEKTILMSDGLFSDGVYVPAGICNGAEQDPTGTDGLLLNVHPIGNASGVNYLMPLFASGRNFCRFDKVIFSGSTVTMSKITIFQE
jgi:hypothetical protein